MNRKWINRLLMVPLAPTIAFMWLVGWTLYWIGVRKGRVRMYVTGDRCIERLREKVKNDQLSETEKEKEK